jgi:hypothetical protein
MSHRYYYHRHITTIILGLGSTNEQEYSIFGFLSWLISLNMMISSSIHMSLAGKRIILE